MGVSRGILLVLAISALCFFPDARAQPAGTVMSVESLEGEVLAGGAPIFRGQRLRPGTRITTGPGASIALRFDDGMYVVLNELTILVPVDFRASTRAVFNLLSGAVRVRTGEVARSNPKQFIFRTSQAQLGVEGPADFSVAVSDVAYLNVASGTVIAVNTAGTSRIAAGSTARVPSAASPASVVALASLPASISSAFRVMELLPGSAAADAPPAPVAAAPTPAAEAPAGTATPPDAQASKMWVGVSVGQVKFDEGLTSRLITSGTVDTEATGFKLFAGYAFHRNFGVEVGYADLGEASYSGSFNGTPITGGKLQVGGLDAALLARAPLGGRLTLFGKVGIFVWEAEANDTAAGVPFSAKTDGSDAFFGLGAAYAITRAAALRLEAEGRKIGDDSVNLLSIGVEFRF